MFRSQLRTSARSVWVFVAASVGIAVLMVTFTQAQTQNSTQQTVTSADVPEAELEQFAKGLEDALEIQQKLKEKLASVQDGAEAQRLQQQANVEMFEAIQEHGIDVERYNAIARSISQDPELAKRVQAKRKELQGAD